jgi:hypothetical protein
MRKTALMAALYFLLVIFLGSLFINQTPEKYSPSTQSEELTSKIINGLKLNTSDIGYSLNTKAGYFSFEAGFVINNTNTFNVILYDANVTLQVYDINFYSERLEPIIEIPSTASFHFSIPETFVFSRFYYVNDTFHESDYRFDFRAIVEARAHSRVYEGPVEISWNRRLGFLHYPEAILGPVLIRGGKSVYQTLNVTDQDRAELIRLTLIRALVDKEIPDYELIKDKEHIVLSKENIAQELVSEIPGVNLIVLDPGEIKEKANREGDFLYLRFELLDFHNEEKAVVKLDNVWMKSSTSSRMYLSGGGFTIFYIKDLGIWKGEIVSSWIS